MAWEYLIWFVVLAVINEEAISTVLFLSELEAIVNRECQSIAINLLVFELFELAGLNEYQASLASYKRD